MYFVCVFCSRYVFVFVCICSRYVFLCICMCMSSLPRTLLLPNLSSKYPYFSSIPFVYAVFAVFLQLLFSVIVIYLLSICLYLFHGGGVMIVFKIGSIRCNANVRTYFRSYKTSYNLFFLYIVYILYIGTFNVLYYSMRLCGDMYPGVVRSYALNNFYFLKN